LKSNSNGKWQMAKFKWFETYNFKWETICHLPFAFCLLPFELFLVF